MSTFAENNKPIDDDPETIIVRDKYIHNMYQSNPTLIEKKQEKNGYKILAGISAGANYTESASISYGNQNKIPKETVTNAIIPIHLEVETPLQSQVSFGAGGSYIINPLWNSSQDFGIKIFDVKTNYSMYGKINYHFTKALMGYIIGGATQFDIFVYNDATNKLLKEEKVIKPSFGLGFAIKAQKKYRIFADITYSNINPNIKYNGSDARLQAISQRKYNSIQAKAGFLYNII